jgi:PAS domain S-box-containing protein
VEADSGVAALRCIMARDFAVILLDVRMPTMSGFETARHIRLRKQSEMTPIIFITALGADEIVAEEEAKAAVDVMLAPVQPDELRAKVSYFASVFLKAEELATQAREVQASADQLRLLTDAAPVGIFQTDAENRYTYTNPRWSEITGMSAAEVAGRSWDSIIDPEQRAGLAMELAAGDAAHEDLSHRFEIKLPRLGTRVVLITSKAILARDGSTSGWVGTLADITTEAGAEAAMSAARDHATEASRLKSDFLANMSHEIRTPMNGVIGMTDLLLETDLGAAQRDYAQTVRNSGEALLAIINDILDFSKVEAGKLEIEDIDFSVRAVVDDVIDLMSGSALAKGLELLSVVDREVPSLTTGDPGRVRQVLTNLVGNAIKFTQAGEVVVRVTESSRLDDGCIIRFEVSDTGDGIEPDKLGLIFAPFVQADSSTSRQYGGTGLGLAISTQLVDLMGGDYGVTSTLGNGSMFWFTIAVHAATSQATPILPSRHPDLHGLNALVVDDSATQLCILRDYLTGWGMNVTTATSGAAGLALLEDKAAEGRPFDVVLVDRYMPEMDGLELRNSIVIDPVLSPRIVLMTGRGQEGAAGSHAEFGFCASVSKPLHVEELYECLRIAARSPAATAEPTKAVSRSMTRRGDQDEATRQNLGRVLLVEDNLINQKVAVAMLSSAGYWVDTVLNGAAAVQAINTHSYDVILMDCQMPVLNGYEATAAIRALEGAHRHTPIIAMTAGARREDRERCLAEGMDGYLAKPVSKDALLTMLARSVKQVLPPSSPVSHIGTTAATEATIDQSVIDELRMLGLATEQDFVGELVDHFVYYTDLLMVQLREASASGDDLAVGRIAHNIQGSGGQLGGRRLAHSSGRLERMATTGGLTGGAADLAEVEDDYQEMRRILIEQQPPRDQESGGLSA